MPSSTPIPDAAVEAAEKAIFTVVDGNLAWNLKAYGKAWTGEGEDTAFVISDAPRRALEAAYPAIEADLLERLLGDEVVEAFVRHSLGGARYEACPPVLLATEQRRARDLLEAAIKEVRGE